MLIIPEDLSYQLGMEPCVYIGPRTKGTLTMDVDYQYHTIYICYDLDENGVVRDSEALLLKEMAVSPHLKEVMKT